MRIKSLTEFVTEKKKISIDINNIKDKVLTTMVDKGVAASAMSIKTSIGEDVTIDQVNNILKDLEKGGKIIKTDVLGHDKFEFIQTFEGNQPGYELDELSNNTTKGLKTSKSVDNISKFIDDLKDNGPSSLPVSKKTKGISVDINELTDRVLNVMIDKGVKMSTYTISGHVGIKANNILSDLEAKGKVVKTTWGKDDFWFIQNFK